MAIFTNNRTHLGRYDDENVVANENYIGSIGALQASFEGLQNDQAIFESLIEMDFREAAAINEGYAEVEIFTEASVGGFVDKVKQFLIKAWEKIKGIFKTFITKFDSVVMRDNKAYFNKYEKQVMKKDLSKLKFKWCKPTGIINEKLDSIDKVKTDVQSKITKAVNGIEKHDKDLESGDLLDSFLSKYLNNNTTTDSKSFAQDFREKMFDEVDTEEGLSSQNLMYIKDTLTTKNPISSIQKAKNQIDKYFNEILKEIEKLRNDIKHDENAGPTPTSARMKNGTSLATYNANNKDQVATAISNTNTVYRVVSVAQTAMNMYVSNLITNKKFEIKQCRAVYTKAAAFNPKAVKENALLVEAAGEAAEYDIMTTFEDYSF